jgi:hypothetical protein
LTWGQSRILQAGQHAHPLRVVRAESHAGLCGAKIEGSEGRVHAADRLLPAWLGTLHPGAFCVRSHRASRLDGRCLRALAAYASRDV